MSQISAKFYELFGKEAFERRALAEQNLIQQQEIERLRKALEEATEEQEQRNAETE